MPYRAVAFDLLTALLDSWTLWNEVAGDEEAGLRWRREYLRLTYGTGPYRPYEAIVAAAAASVGLAPALAATLAARWDELAKPPRCLGRWSAACRWRSSRTARTRLAAGRRRGSASPSTWSSPPSGRDGTSPAPSPTGWRWLNSAHHRRRPSLSPGRPPTCRARPARGCRCSGTIAWGCHPCLVRPNRSRPTRPCIPSSPRCWAASLPAGGER